MNWETIVQLIITYGIDQAYNIWKIAHEGDPTEESWEKLRLLSLKSYDDYIRDAQAKLQPPPQPPTPPQP
ncbi:MAG: hypothetical protein V4563_14540 [Pseudomonadota bacterium]